MLATTVYPKKYAHGFIVLCFVVVMQSFIIDSHEVFIHIHILIIEQVPVQFSRILLGITNPIDYKP